MKIKTFSGWLLESSGGYGAWRRLADLGLIDPDRPFNDLLCQLIRAKYPEVEAAPVQGSPFSIDAQGPEGKRYHLRQNPLDWQSFKWAGGGRVLDFRLEEMTADNAVLPDYRLQVTWEAWQRTQEFFDWVLAKDPIHESSESWAELDRLIDLGLGPEGATPASLLVDAIKRRYPGSVAWSQSGAGRGETLIGVTLPGDLRCSLMVTGPYRFAWIAHLPTDRYTREFLADTQGKRPGAGAEALWGPTKKFLDEFADKIEESLGRLVDLGLLDPVEAAKSHLVEISRATEWPIRGWDQTWADLDEWVPIPDPLDRLGRGPLGVEIRPSDGALIFLWAADLWDRAGRRIPGLRDGAEYCPWREFGAEDWERLIRTLKMQR